MIRTILIVVAAFASVISTAQVMDLSGTWQFTTATEPHYDDEIILPGSMLTNGKGNEVTVNTQWVGSLYDSSYFFNPYMAKYRIEGSMKFPFFLTPDKHYVGKAWYGRTISIPKEWDGNRIFLHLERPHIETTIHIDGHLVGRDSSLSVPHDYELTDFVTPGSTHRLDIAVYNGIENVCVGQDSHSVTDQTQGDWNGIVGAIELRSRPRDYIRDVQVFASAKEGTLRVVYDIVGQGMVEAHVFGKVYNCSKEITIPLSDGVKLWDEFNPNLYTLTSVMGRDTISTTFGVRDFNIEGRQFIINGRRAWLRGTVENCCFPLTGYPPTDVGSWMSLFRKCKEYGLNLVRFHSYCPPEAAFTAADSIGIYLQPEGPSWPNHGVRLGRGMSIDHYLLEETQRIVQKYGNHPSFCMLAAGNEPAGDWVTWVGQFVDYWKSTGDNRRVYCGASVGGGWAFDHKSEFHVKGGAKGLTWDKSTPQTTDDFQDAIKTFVQRGRKDTITFNINEPYITHELGQWCAFPDLQEVSQYTGAYKAKNFDIFADLLADNGMKAMAEKFLYASGKLQTLCYKYDIERNLRTPGYAGFEMLSLNDYSGQGTALVGVLNVFWREKGYCNANDWRQFCSPIVPLARFPRFVYSSTDTLSVDVELYNASATVIDEPATYTITNTAGSTIVFGILTNNTLPISKNIPLGRVTLPLNIINEAQKLTLTLTIANNTNTYDFWVYPPIAIAQSDEVLITDRLNDEAMAVLDNGGKVLLTAAGRVTLGDDVSQSYLPVFWNTSWFKMRPPHTTGVYIDTSHPLFSKNKAVFPTDCWSDLQWWEIVNGAQVMNLRELPSDYQSPIQPIDTWHVSRKLGMIIEAKVGSGKLLMTTADITTDLDHRLAARQLRHAIINYMESEAFEPTLTLDASTINHFFTSRAPAVNMFTTDSPDELKPTL